MNFKDDKQHGSSYNQFVMDSLKYDYTGKGNKLNYVHDFGNALEGFVNSNTGVDDYDYDFNGNLDRDRNKGFSSKGDIKYNYLNLPKEIIKGTERIKYIYDASGRKLRQEVYTNNGGTLVKYTDYIGELVYEGGNLQFIQQQEGRVIPDGGSWEYQYHLKDHLGNIRVTFTTKPQPTINYNANLEDGNTNSGEDVFDNYTSTTYDLVDHTDAGTSYQRVQWLNGGASGRVGLTKSLSVMPGDRISVEAFAKYRNLSGTGNPNVFATALTAAFGVSSGSSGEQLRLYNSLNSYGLGVAGGEHPDDDDTAPKAFVTILLFDRNFNLLDATWDQVTTDLEQVSAVAKEPFDHPLSTEITVQEAGYAYVFVSNEHPTYVDVYFDDITVTHTVSPIVSSSDYFPFGLSFNAGQKQGSVGQQHLYNGKELQDELSLNWYDYGARMYMPEIGRWGVIDPLSENSRRWTPYRFAFNNPLRFTDPDGMEEEDKTQNVTVGTEYSDGYSTRNALTETASVSVTYHSSEPYRTAHAKGKAAAQSKVTYDINLTTTAQSTAKVDENSPSAMFSRWKYEKRTDDGAQQGGCWWCTDSQGEFFFNHWQNGNGQELFLNNEEWGNYMRGSDYLSYMIGAEMNKRYAGSSGGTIIGRMHGETGVNGYSNGYGMLNGSNAYVGDLEYFGVAVPGTDGSMIYNLTMTFHDIMDPNFQYDYDRIGASIYPGTPYNVHITWSLSLTVSPPPVPTQSTRH